MMGMEMMVKQMLGVDLDELKAHAAQLISQAQEMGVQMEHRITGIEMALQVISKNQNQLCALLIQMRDGATPADKPAAIEHEEKEDGPAIN